MKGIDEEIQRLVSGDSILFGVAMVVILLYLSLTLGRLDRLNARFYLAWSGVVTVLLSLIVAFGITSYLKLDANAIVFLLPFILVGVGVDDMIVMVHCFDSYRECTDLTLRMRKTLTTAGSAITLTTMTSVLAFLTGIFSPLPGVQSFCANALVAFAWTFVLSITLFPSFVVLDQRRVEANRHAIFLYTLKKPEPSPSSPQAHSKIVQTPKAQPHAYKIHDLWTRVILSRVGKTFVLLSALASAIVIPIFVLDQVEVGLLTRDVIPDDSYINKALDLWVRHWSENTGTYVTIVSSDFDYADVEMDEKLEAYVSWFSDATFALPPFGGLRGSWHQRYKTYLTQVQNTTVVDFYVHLGAFLNLYPEFQQDVVCRDDACQEIEASRISCDVLDPENTRLRYEIMSRIYAKMAELGLGDKLALDGPTLMFATMDNVIPQLTLNNMLMTVGAIFLTLLFFTNVWISLFIALMVASIDLHLVSVLVYWNIKLNAVSFVNLVMSVGLSVDYCVHIGHAFARAPGGSGDLRVQHTIRSMGASVAQGGFTTFVGVMLLAFASSEAFRIFFKMLLATVVYGLYHALVVLPVVLALVGDVLVPKAGEGTESTLTESTTMDVLVDEDSSSEGSVDLDRKV